MRSLSKSLAWFLVPFAALVTAVESFNAFVLDPAGNPHFTAWGPVVRHWAAELSGVAALATAGLLVAFGVARRVGWSSARSYRSTRLAALSAAGISVSAAEIFNLLHYRAAAPAVSSPYVDWIALSYVAAPAIAAFLVLAGVERMRDGDRSLPDDGSTGQVGYSLRNGDQPAGG